MYNPDKNNRTVEEIRQQYSPGTRVVLLQMGNDPNPIEPNAVGTVITVDDIGTVHCVFDNGRRLGLIPGKDMFHPLAIEEIISNPKMKAVVVEPLKPAEIMQIDSGLTSLQNLVGGYIQAVYPYDDPVAIICNEEGKMLGLPLNRALKNGVGNIYDILAGTFAVVGIGGEEFVSLSDDLADKYQKVFACPEQFLRVNNAIVSIPCDPSDDQAPLTGPVM